MDRKEVGMDSLTILLLRRKIGVLSDIKPTRAVPTGAGMRFLFEIRIKRKLSSRMKRIGVATQANLVAYILPT
jgi:hypothetical protein